MDKKWGVLSGFAFLEFYFFHLYFVSHSLCDFTL
nr:MAG TPA: hypothetical protein [Caudoviricetes sp.]